MWVMTYRVDPAPRIAALRSARRKERRAGFVCSQAEADNTPIARAAPSCSCRSARGSYFSDFSGWRLCLALPKCQHLQTGGPHGSFRGKDDLAAPGDGERGLTPDSCTAAKTRLLNH